MYIGDATAQGLDSARSTQQFEGKVPGIATRHAEICPAAGEYVFKKNLESLNKTKSFWRQRRWLENKPNTPEQKRGGERTGREAGRSRR